MRALKTLCVAATMLFMAGTAEAAVYQLQFDGLDIVYFQSFGVLCTTTSGTYCELEPLDNLNFRKDGSLEGQLLAAANLSASILMQFPVGTDPTVNATHAIGGSLGIFDILIGGVGVAGILTDISTGSVTFSNLGINATGSGFSILFEPANLPFGFDPQDPIKWSFSTGTGSCTGTAGNLVCSFSGTGELSWETREVAEPVTLALLGMSLFGVAATRRRLA